MLEFKNKRVLVTGHTGFKGSWLTLWLKHLGANICGYSSIEPVSTPNHYNLLNLQNEILDIRGDILDREKLNKTFNEFQPEIVFHLAAQALVRQSYSDPISTFEVNAIGTMNVLEAIRHTKSVKVVVIISSDKCYRNDEQVWGYKETDFLGGHDPYSASKSCTEIIAHSYFDSFFTSQDSPACVTVRAGNVIGGGDWAQDRIVPDCAKAWSSNNTVVLRSPKATRPWQLVLEPLSGYLHLADILLKKPYATYAGLPLNKEAYNFGPSSSLYKTVEDVTNYLQKYWNNMKYTVDPSTIGQAKECNFLKVCCDKALAYLGWEANLTFDETMEFTAIWYKEYYNNCKNNAQKIRDLSLSQIIKYEQIAKERKRAWFK